MRVRPYVATAVFSLALLPLWPVILVRLIVLGITVAGSWIEDRFDALDRSRFVIRFITRPYDRLGKRLARWCWSGRVS